MLESTTILPDMGTNPTASDMAKIRWARTTKEQRTAYGRMMAKARWLKKPRRPKKES